MAASSTSIEATAPTSINRAGVRRSTPASSPRLRATAAPAPASTSHAAPARAAARAARPTKASITGPGAVCGGRSRLVRSAVVGDLVVLVVADHGLVGREPFAVPGPFDQHGHAVFEQGRHPAAEIDGDLRRAVGDH